MSNHFKVALLQIKSGNYLDENFKIGINACKKAHEMGAV